MKISKCGVDLKMTTQHCVKLYLVKSENFFISTQKLSVEDSISMSHSALYAHNIIVRLNCTAIANPIIFSHLLYGP